MDEHIIYYTGHNYQALTNLFKILTKSNARWHSGHIPFTFLDEHFSNGLSGVILANNSFGTCYIENINIVNEENIIVDVTWLKDVEL